jgi:diguanylate cyclase (GGDEF)-like protein
MSELGPAERILVCDDDDHTRNLLKELCESSGFDTLVAQSGEAALELMERTRPDLVLLDLMMPGMDGFAVLKHMKERPDFAELPVIVVSANTDIEGKIKGLELGADDYVTKPFKLFELVTRIRAALTVRRYRKRLEEAQGQLADLVGGDVIAGVGTFAQLGATLDHEVSRARRYGRPLAALLLTVDDVDAIRDAYSRDEVDRMLAQLAEAVRSAARGVDRLFRLDVEEFVVLLPETDSSAAVIAAERLCAAVSKGVYPTGHPKARPLTVSVGVAVFPGDRTRSADELIRAANEAMKAARKTGPGRVARFE